jgi:hypothetical protein
MPLGGMGRISKSARVILRSLPRAMEHFEVRTRRSGQVSHSGPPGPPPGPPPVIPSPHFDDRRASSCELWLPARGMAVWPGRSHLVAGGLAKVVAGFPAWLTFCFPSPSP